MLTSTVVVSWMSLWFDFMKTLLLLEFASLISLSFIIMVISAEYSNLMYLFLTSVFSVCESSIGFMIFIFYASTNYEIVSKSVPLELQQRFY